MPQSIEPFSSIPDDIDGALRDLLAHPHDPAIGAWLLDLIKASGHLSTSDDLRWRVLVILWLAAEYDPESAWPYLMWLNMNKPLISDHLAEIVAEALDDFNCHVRLAHWKAAATDERLVQFLNSYRAVPIPYKVGDIFLSILDDPEQPGLETWLADFCRQTADHSSEYMRPWHLLAAAWYAARYNSDEGLSYLQRLSGGRETLPPEANQSLTKTTAVLNCTPQLSQWIAACPEPAVQTMLKEFGHPDLRALAAAVFAKEPAYQHLPLTPQQATHERWVFRRNLDLLEKAGKAGKSNRILDLGCGPLTGQTILFHAAGYPIIGVGLDVPPAYLPVSGIIQRFRRGKYVRAWEAASAPYFQILARESGLKLNWKTLDIEMADPARLDYPAASFDVVICCDYLSHVPDVNGLLAEANRVLKPGGILIADFVPYPALGGAFTGNSTSPWQHLLPDGQTVRRPGLVLNQWRESQYRAALESYFRLQSWLPEQDETAPKKLSSELRQALSDYSTEELTRKMVVVVARK